MEQLRIKKIDEATFDLLIERAGGSRISEEGSADYRLNEAVIELKLLEEEGLEKEERRKKLASIFRGNQPTVPTVVLDPRRLNAEEKRACYNSVSGPIQQCIKKGVFSTLAVRLDGV